MAWSATPAPRALSVLQDVVQKYVGNPSDAEAATLATEALNDGIRKLDARDWFWSLGSEDVTLAADAADRVLATNTARKVRHVDVLNTSDKPVSFLRFKDAKSFEIEHPDRSASGTPRIYTAFNLINDGTITLDVPPSSGYIAVNPTLRVRMFRRLLYYATSTDTLTTLLGGTGFAPVEVESFLQWHASAYLGLRYLEASNPKVVRALQLADEIWNRLIADDLEPQDWA